MTNTKLTKMKAQKTSIKRHCRRTKCLYCNTPIYLNFSRAINNLRSKGYNFFLTVVNQLSWSAKNQINTVIKAIQKTELYLLLYEKIGIELLIIAEPHKEQTIHLNIYTRANKGYDKNISEQELIELLNELGRTIKTELKKLDVANGKIKQETAVTRPANEDCASMEVIYAHKLARSSYEYRKALLSCNNNKLYLFKTKNFFDGSREKQSREFKRNKRNLKTDIYYCFGDKIKISEALHTMNWLPLALYLIYREIGLYKLLNITQGIVEIVKHDKSIKDTGFHNRLAQKLGGNQKIDLNGTMDEYLTCVRLYALITSLINQYGINITVTEIQALKTSKELKNLLRQIIKQTIRTNRDKALVLIKPLLSSYAYSDFFRFHLKNPKTYTLLPSILLSLYFFIPLRL